MHIAIFLIVAIVTGWTVALWRFFRSTRMSNREKAAAWLGVGAFVCFMLGISDYQYLHWRNFAAHLAWHGVWLALSLAFILALRFVVPKDTFPASTPFTVESESPSHVIRADDV